MHVVVVGAGVFGAWTAHHLLARGAAVTLVEAYGPAHSRSSSGDETRIVRCGYGPDAIYSDLARRSLDQWRALSDRAARPDPLWHPAGVLWMAAGNDSYTAATRETLSRLNVPPDVLSRSDMRIRFPHFDTEGIEVSLLERECGVVAARRAVRALVADLEQRGARIVTARVQPPSAADAAANSAGSPTEPIKDRGADPVRSASSVPIKDRGADLVRSASSVRALRTQGGVEAAGDRFVFACGAWLPALFPELLRGRIRPTRQVVTYFGTPAGDRRFTATQMPAWIDFPSGIYGTPDIDGRGVKVGIDEHGGPIDPDADDRMPDRPAVDRARAWLTRRVPALADAPVVETRVCAYENTATGDFLIDRHPAHDNVWIAGGGSGHGFKHGPAVGELMARMVLDGESPDARFTLAGKTIDERRSVY
jgi:sarcosine oxidase